MSGSGISLATCKSAPRSRQITTPAPHHSVFYRPDALPAAQPTVSKHWRQPSLQKNYNIVESEVFKKFVNVSVRIMLMIKMSVSQYMLYSRFVG